MAIEEGKAAPAFTLKDQNGKPVKLSDFKGKHRLVLFAYPKANTPGWTTEAQEFSALAGEFAGCGAVAVGISADSVEAQKKFEVKQGLSVPLLSDPDKQTLEAYGLFGEKKMYGITRTGIIRSTVVVGKDGKVEKIFRNVKAKGHAAKVLEHLQGWATKWFESQCSAQSTDGNPARSRPMPIPTPGTPAPNFSTTDEKGNKISLADYRGKAPVALVFYPKDDTPGWTKQFCSLRDSQSKLDKAGVRAFGISYDSAADHAAFRSKYGLTTPLLMDTGKQIGAAYGLSQGEYPERKTFVIAKDGKLAAVIEKIDFADHGGQILAALGLQ